VTEQKTYSDEELVRELTVIVDGLGGSFESIDIKNRIFKLEIAAEAQDYAHLMVNDIMEKYAKERLKLMKKNPFIRTQMMRDEMFK